MSLTSMLVAPFAGRLVDRIEGKYLLFGGLLLFSAGMLLVIREASLSSTGLSFTPALIVAGLGMGCTFAPMVTLTMRNVPPTMAGAASGFLNTIRQVGAAFGSAVVGAILQHQLAADLKSQAIHYSAQLPASFRARFVDGFSHAATGGFAVGRGQTGTTGHLPANLPANVAREIQAISHAVFNHGFLLAMKPALAIPVSLMLLGSIGALFMARNREQQEARMDVEEPRRIAATGS
jgi:MFS family permease